MANRAHIFRNYVASAANECIGSGCTGKSDRRTGGASEANDVLKIAQAIFCRETSGEYDIDDVTFNFFVEIDLFNTKKS